MNRPELTPVLVGIGTATRHEEDFHQALEPLDLMLEAVNAAGSDSGASSTPALLRGVQYIAVPRGRWSYVNPAGAIAHSIGAHRATTVLATVGVLQQTLIGEACARIARGEAQVTLVTGADAGYRLLRAQIAGEQAGERATNGHPDILLAPKDELRHPAERRAGMQMPVGLYAILESAFRAKHEWSVAEHRDRIAALFARFSRIAAANPDAWQRAAVDATTIRDATARNPMQAFPYTRAHCSSWNVDQAGALLFCSSARADELGIPRERWIHPVASTESNHMVPVSARGDLAECPGARIAGRAALEAGNLAIADVDLIDLYSCFPVAVEMYAEALGLDAHSDNGRALTLTGGMPFAGGPYNNYVLQSTCRAARLLREMRHESNGRTALVSSVSGTLTKQGFGLWSTAPAPNGFVDTEVTGEVAQAVRTLDVCDDYTGPGTVAGFTVLHARGEHPKGVALVDTPHAQRALATTEDAALIARMEEDEFVGRDVRIDQNRMCP